MLSLKQNGHTCLFKLRKMLLPTLISAGVLVVSACSSSLNDKSEQVFLETRAELIEKLSAQDNTFSALQAQINTDDPESAEYWRWRIDQYLYGQYPEYQPIYNTYTQGKTFQQIYDLPPEQLGPKKPQPLNTPELPDGYFTENLPGNPHHGWHDVVDDKVYISYQGQLTDPYVAIYNLKSQQWDGPNKAAESTLSKGERKIDSHGRPIIELDSKGHIHIVYGGHGGEREDGLNPLSIDTPHAGGRMLHVMSAKPYDISEFVYVNDITPFASYTASEKMANGDIYLFTRAGTHKSPWVYYKMKSGEQRFEPPVVITWPTPQKDNPINVDTFYITPLKISDTEIAISSLWHECNFNEVHNKENYGRINSYYMKLDTTTDTFYNAQQQKLTLPITLATANQKTLAFDSTQREETPFGTSPIIREDNVPAVAYQARTKNYREWRMTAFENGEWKHSQPMPNTVNRTLFDSSNRQIDKIMRLEILANNPNKNTALVIYKNAQGKSVFATAQRQDNTVQNWHVTKAHLSLANTRLSMEPIKNESGDVVAAIVNIKKGAAQRLYLWHEGQFRANNLLAN
ncbi:BNR-4 repeat-containing protein [Catenovulum adriaticum]|uniref:BNR-4 repeat-containing protein n=1 Tax=Catenovulum adriaticum TaxID=2984846 RepID=A0ABY7AS31_9ALTE|nr:BNR-4 repeat-containing protein [Catenovulum sp. TS8]WAJ71931.1 BNR-4 repeat-containing protein [Catenovulum sp. TS8]